MATSTDYWLQGMQVADQDKQTRNRELQDKRDYAARNKVYYGEDWRGDGKGDTDFGASEAARKQRMADDAKAAAEVYLGGSRNPASTGNSGLDLGAPKSAAINPEVPIDSPRLVPVNDFGAPSAAPVAAVKVVESPQLKNSDWTSDPNWSFDEMGAPRSVVKPVVQPDEPRYIPIQGGMGAPAAVPAITTPVSPSITRDYGASAAPVAPVRPTSPVPNTGTFGAPLAQSTAREIFERTDPKIRDNPAFRTALATYEKDRLNKISRLEQAEEIANIRMLGALQQSLVRGESNTGLETLRQKGRETLKDKDTEGKSDLEDKRQEGRKEAIQLKEANRQLVASGKPPVLDKATEREVAELGAAIGKKVVVSNSLKNQSDQMADTNLDPALRLAAAKGSLKTLNSAEGRDAVGKEEAERIGGLLKINLNVSDFILGRPLAPSLRLFTEQVKNKANALQSDVSDARSRVKEIYAPYGYDPERPRTAEAQMRAAGISTEESPSPAASTNSPSGPRVMTITGTNGVPKKVTFTPRK